ncbi:MAG: hypothetical protein AAF206_02595 [Bacteroidota bacterium]
MKRNLFTLVILLLLFSSVNAQERIALRHQPFQFSLLYPIGTEGLSSGNTANYLSVNLLAGYTGAVTGFEFGGFLNAVRYDVVGMQFAGFGNVVGNHVRGGQFAGFVNVTGKDAKGIQMAGFANVIGRNGTGIQGAGFVNLNRGSYYGIQLAGFANINGGDVYGIQAAGLLNVAREVRGIQLGFVNFANSYKGGAPIGFLSIVRDGYLALELGVQESLGGTASIKTGVPGFYNIFSVGLRPDAARENIESWSFGYGIGTRLRLGQGVGITLDAITYQVNEDGAMFERLNLLNRIQPSLTLDLGKHLSLYGGPALNVMISEIDIDSHNGMDQFTGSSLLPENLIYDRVWDCTRVSMYWGFQAGIRIK